MSNRRADASNPELAAASRLRIGGCRAWLDAHLVLREGEETRVTPKAIAVLRQLVRAAPHTVSRDELLSTVWADGCPTDEVVTQAIAELRRAFGEAAREGRCIETVPRVGYRLRCPVSIDDEAPPAFAVDAGAPPRRDAFDPETPAVAAEDAAPAPVADAQPTPPTATKAATKAVPPTPRRSARPLAWAGVIAVAGVLAVLLPGLDRWPAAAHPAGHRVPPRPVTAAPSRERFPGLSPDGSLVAFSLDEDADGALQVKGLAVADVALRITDPPAGASDVHPVWFPDGSRIAFLRTRGKRCRILVVPALGGPTREVGSCYARTVDYFDVTPDGRHLLVSRQARELGADGARTQLARLDLAGGRIAPIDYRPHAEDEHDIEPKASPDGRWIAFRRGVAPYSALWLVPSGGGEARPLVERRARIRGIAWYPDSSALLAAADWGGTLQLWKVPLDGGEPTALGGEDSHFPTVARMRPIAVAVSERQIRAIRELALSDGRLVEGRATTRASRSDEMPVYAPDGSRFAFVSRRSGTPEVWLHDFASGRAEPLTEIGGPEVEWPQWSPDGAALVFVVRGAQSVLMQVDLAGRRVVQRSPEGMSVRFGSFAADGRALWASALHEGRWGLWRIDGDGGAALRLADNGALDPRQPAGERAVYYVKDLEWGLFRYDLDRGTETMLPAPLGLFARSMYSLRPDGLWFVDSPDPQLPMALFNQTDLSPGTDAEDERPVRLVAEVPRDSPLGQVALAPDGTRLLLVDTVHDESDLVAVDLR
jgi:Tol biopolymer transport system component/DNA-binding winged helix-turn-helix (wHTH) protein